MAADNNKNDKVRQLYKEDGASKIYPVVIKDSVSDGAGNYGVNAFGTWFRETDMEVKSLSVCEDIKFWEETSTKDSFASVRVKDSSMFINMPLTIGMNNNGYSVKNLTVIAENTSIDSSVLTVKAKKTIVNSRLEITDASINKLTVKGSSFTGESTFNDIVTMKTGLTVYAETDNTAINISTKGTGPQINITGTIGSSGEINAKNMDISLFGSDVAIYSDDSASHLPASITKNGYGKFNTLHIGPMDPENMYSSHLLNDSNWNSDNILKKPSDGSIVFSTTRFGFPGILSEENHIVAIDNNNKINVLRLNYPTSKTHSSVLMYDASVYNNLTSKLLKVNSNLVLQNNALTGHSQIKAENGLDIYAPNSGIIDIICNTNGRVAIKQGNNTGNDTVVMVVDSSKLYYGITPIPSDASGLKIKASSGIIDSDSSIILRASAEFTVSTKAGTDIYSNRLIINSSYSIFNTEVKAKVNGVSDVYLGVPIGSVVTFPYYTNQSMWPAHWVMLSKHIKYLGYTQDSYVDAFNLLIPAKKYVYSGDTTASSNPVKYRRTYTTTDLGSGEAYTDKISYDANIKISKSVKSDNMNYKRIYWFSAPLNINFDIAVVYNYYEYVCNKYCENFLFNYLSDVVIDLTDEKMANSDKFLLDYDNILLNMLEEKMMKVE